VSHPLDGARGRVARGSDHVQQLKASVVGGFQGGDNAAGRVSTHIDLKDQACVLTVGALPDPPPEYPFLISEAAHNFRSALNYVVMELAWIDSRGNARVADKGQQWPIESVRGEWTSKRVQAMLGGLIQRHKADIKRFQPFNLFKPPPHPLLFLNALSNDDKHRLLHPVMGAASLGMVSIPYRGRNCRVDLKRYRRLITTPMLPPKMELGAEITRIPLIIDGPDPEMQVQFNGFAFLGIGQGLSVVDELERVAATVKYIVEGFAPEFDRPSAKRIRRIRAGKLDGIAPQPAAYFLYQRSGDDWPKSTARMRQLRPPWLPRIPPLP
jgi:hypothetical protein